MKIEKPPLLDYKVSERVGPLTIPTLETEITAAADTTKARDQDWSLCCLHSLGIPSSTSFNILTRENVPVRPETITILAYHQSHYY